MECYGPAGDLRIWDLFQCLTSESPDFKIFKCLSFYSILFTITWEVRAVWKDWSKKSWMGETNFLQKLQWILPGESSPALRNQWIGEFEKSGNKVWTRDVRASPVRQVSVLSRNPVRPIEKSFPSIEKSIRSIEKSFSIEKYNLNIPHQMRILYN